jgi:hypothetical protein
MFSEDNIATAQIAQLFGSELLRVQENSKTDSGYVPSIVTVHPKQFLVNTAQQQTAKQTEEYRMLQALQREAELTHPIRPPSQPTSEQSEQNHSNEDIKEIVREPVLNSNVIQPIVSIPIQQTDRLVDLKENMILTIDKTSFLENILTPVSKIAENLQLFFQSEGDKSYIKTIVSSADNSIVFSAKVPCTTTQSNSFVIPDCKTFMRLFSGITNDEITLEVNSNNIAHKSNELSFKYHLLDEAYVHTKKSISEEKLNALTFETRFKLSKTKLSEITKFNSIVPDAQKLYFYSDKETRSIFVELDDKQICNTNSVKLKIAETYEGDSLKEELPLNIQSILLFSFFENIIDVSINQQLKLFKFQTDKVTYVVSGLVK